MADDELMDILEESDAESELTESGEDRGDASEEEEGDQKPLQGKQSSSVQEPVNKHLESGGFEGRSDAMLLKQEIFGQSDPGWLAQHLAKGQLSKHIQVKEEDPGRRRSRGN